VPDLQAIFADTILKAQLGPDEKDERVYDLNPVRSRQFQFVYGPESGIADVAVKKLRLKVRGKIERIVLDADPTYNKHAIFDLLDKVAKGIPLMQMAVTQVGIKVTFDCLGVGRFSPCSSPRLDVDLLPKALRQIPSFRAQSRADSHFSACRRLNRLHFGWIEQSPPLTDAITVARDNSEGGGGGLCARPSRPTTTPSAQSPTSYH
jgi:hypothetical protein